MSTLGERLKMIRGAEKQEDFAARMGISKSSMSGYEKDENLPGADAISKICLKAGISSDWLLFGKGSMQGSEEAGVARALDHKVSPEDLIMIPMVDAILSAGTGSLETSGQMAREYAFRQDFILRKGNPANMVLMRVRGDSMQPEVMDNDVVLLDQSKTRPHPGPIFAVGIEDAIYLKRVDMLPGQIILKSVNTDYEPIRIDMGEQTSDQFRVIGQVLWVGREYK
ncbi:MAG: helix-turn-helix transcriptional regulator [Desulfovibrio sp.]|uniref:XRE family transcriptional regulator n=1 Tax=Desulfovibrio sp. TaxID=885 RepID=UPI001A6707CA|nr:XRE family transcriptional regulator [Desulfovibrio sp.]MBD5416994.1 helix-turn-helix transcriptional regulator [Desulfovibrio sp.]